MSTLSTDSGVIHKEKKKQKEKGPAYDCSLLFFPTTTDKRQGDGPKSYANDNVLQAHLWMRICCLVQNFPI
jgi:hypothetical protein